MEPKNTRLIVAGAVVLALVVAFFLFSTTPPEPIPDNATVDGVPECITPPPKPSVFCLTSQPEVFEGENGSFGTGFVLWREEAPTDGKDQLMVFTLLDDFEVSTNPRASFSKGDEFTGVVNVLGMKELKIIVKGKKVSEPSGKRGQLQYSLGADYIGLGEQVCKDSDCEVYGVFEWNA